LQTHHTNSGIGQELQKYRQSIGQHQGLETTFTQKRTNYGSDRTNSNTPAKEQATVFRNQPCSCKVQFMQEDPEYSRAQSGCTLGTLVDEDIFSKC